MADKRGGSIEVEVAYALPHVQTVITLQVPAGTCVAEAIARSGIAEHHPEIDWNSAVIGVFGKRVSRSTALRPHDRVEIYRPLSANPRQVRRKRARRQTAR